MQTMNDSLLKLMLLVDNRLSSPSDDEKGQTLVEYGLIVALISIVAIAALTSVGGSIKSVFTSVGNKLHS